MISTATPAGGAIVRDSLGLAEGGIRLSQHEVPLRVNSGSNSGGGFCALDGSSVPLRDDQLAALYPTVQGYVDEVVSVTLANAEKGYIPADFTRDPAWYTDIRDLVNEYGARDLQPVAAEGQPRGGREVRHRRRPLHGDLLPRGRREPGPGRRRRA